MDDDKYFMGNIVLRYISILNQTCIQIREDNVNTIFEIIYRFLPSICMYKSRISLSPVYFHISNDNSKRPAPHFTRDKRSNRFINIEIFRHVEKESVLNRTRLERERVS